MADKTTAQILGAYCRELKAEGVEPQAIETLVIEGARSLLRDNVLTVSDENPAAVGQPCRCGAVRGFSSAVVSVGHGGGSHSIAGCTSN